MTSPITSPMTSRMTSPRIKIGIPGAAGRMGRMLIREIAAAPDLELVAATDRADAEAIGQDSGLLAGTGTNGVLISGNPDSLASAAALAVSAARGGLQPLRAARNSSRGQPRARGPSGRRTSSGCAP